MTHATRPGLIAWVFLIALGVIWGGSFATTSAAVRDIPPLTVVAARLAIAAAVLVPLSFIVGGGPPSRKTEQGRRIWRAAFITAFAANAAPFAALAWAQTHISAGLAGIFMSSLPLMVTPLAAWFVSSEFMTTRKIFGLCLGFAGVIYLIGVDTLGALGGDRVRLAAQIACLAAAFGYAVGSVVAKLSPRTHPVVFGAITVSIAALMLMPIALLVETPWRLAWHWDGVGAVIFLGVFPTALAMVLLYEIIVRAGPSFLSLVNYQVPVWAVIFGVIFLGEQPPGAAPVALIMILAGVAIAQDVNPLKMLRRVLSARRMRRLRPRGRR
jgi:drug/metabolite transporter (DMT)-like permease